MGELPRYVDTPKDKLGVGIDDTEVAVGSKEMLEGEDEEVTDVLAADVSISVERFDRVDSGMPLFREGLDSCEFERVVVLALALSWTE